MTDRLVRRGKRARRDEVHHIEDAGYLSRDNATEKVTQEDIVKNVDITAATKHYKLCLDFGPYKARYFDDGRHLLLGGQRGHVAALDSYTKHLICEFNVQEAIKDVCWLHQPKLLAVAQKDWVHVYDKSGTEMHCLRKLLRVDYLTFLQYHFLLVSLSDRGFISWTDITNGDTVKTYRLRKSGGVVTTMKQNPYNAIVCTGFSRGVIKMWSPNYEDPVAEFLAAPCSISDIAISSNGMHMAVASNNSELFLWDIRKFSPIWKRMIPQQIEHMTFSQRNLLATATGSKVSIYNYKNAEERPNEHVLTYHCQSRVKSIAFANYDDVLGIGTEKGFESILIPGAGEPNIDSFECNPFATVRQRKEMEVKQLLDKLDYRLITLDPDELIKKGETIVKKIRKN